MKTKIPRLLMLFLITPTNQEAAGSNSALSYLLGGIIALIILGYLIYTLLRPDKF
jgi:K+-transporting ATPase KdpF subunit